MRRARETAVAVTLTAVLAGCGGGSTGGGPAAAGSAGGGGGSGGIELVVHRSPDCSCCGGWQAEMRKEGMHVVERHHDDMAEVKDGFGIPDDQRSCHTSEVDGYVVEGHVPAAAIADLLEARPDVDGIALAGMPPGAPGMPGEQAGPLVVTTIVDGEVTGELGRY